MPGVILYRDCKARLDHMRRANPDLFSRRELFVEVMKILETFNFKLTARRDIVSFFPETARLRSREAEGTSHREATQ